MITVISVLHIVSCIILVLVVLIQSGKGAEISATLGGSSQTVFGSSGGANFFTRFTAITASVFMITSLSLSCQGGKEKISEMEGEARSATTAPAQAAASPRAATAASGIPAAAPAAPSK